MKKSLSKKFALIFLITVFGAILIASLISNYRIDQQFDKYLLEEHERKIENIKEMIEDLCDPKDLFQGVHNSEIQRYAVLEDLYIQINDVNGNRVFSSGEEHLYHRRMMGSMMGNMMRGSSKKNMGEYTEEKYPIIKNGEKIGTMIIGYFGVGSVTERDIAFKNTMNQSFVIAIGITLIFALIISSILSKQMTKSLEKITKVANEMRNGNLQIRSEVNTNTLEIDQLSESINFLAQTLQQQEHLRKRLTSDMAHEIRTPLTTLQSHIEALIDGIWEVTPERLKSCHEEIIRLKKLVEDLKNLAKLEKDNFYLDKSGFDLSDMIGKAIESLRSQYTKKNLKIVVDIEPSIKVFMDQDKIKQILFNLLSNAYKYSDEGGIVEIGVKVEEKIIVWVKDGGIGIPKEDLPYIFERFYRTEISRSRETGGVGIGLTITKALIESHNGQIKVESRVGKGSLFTITFSKENMHR
ncbi:MAG: ATP-binding protein [Marinisporobacter sp.]|jgi:signal transduction histidine kinase|nr:ATP-binding protein [Marinisporobacter sp.]